MWVNNLPKIANQWNSGMPWESYPSQRARIPSALTTDPLSHIKHTSQSGDWTLVCPVTGGDTHHYSNWLLILRSVVAVDRDDCHWRVQVPMERKSCYVRTCSRYRWWFSIVSTSTTSTSIHRYPVWPCARPWSPRRRRCLAAFTCSTECSSTCKSDWSSTYVLCCIHVTIKFGSLAYSARWAWNGYQPGLGSIPRPSRINCFRITGVHALRLISWTGKMVWRCPL